MSATRAPRRDFLRANPFPRPHTDGLFYREKMRAIHGIAPASSGPILEIGGGRSGLASLLYPESHPVTVDLDPTELGHGPGAGRASFVHADGTRLPFPDGAFDVVTLFDVLEHVPDDRALALEALRVTRPGGSVLVTTPKDTWRYPHHRRLARWCPPAETLMAEWGHVRVGYSADAVAGLFDRSPAAAADFVNPLTALYHDISFSHLGGRRRRLAYLAAMPVAALGYAAHRFVGRGAEHAMRFEKTA